MNAIRIVFSSLWTAACYPRVWLTAWLLVTLPAIFLVLPALQELRAALDHHPGAEFAAGQHLDADFARLNTGTQVRAGGAMLFVLLAWTFLGGGILATVGLRQRFSYTEFLSESARLFTRNLRVVALGLVVALLVFWGVGVLDRWLREDVLYNADPSPIEVFGLRSPFMTPEFGLEMLSYLWGLLFLGILFASKVARARLAVDNRRSALLAWLRAGASLVRHPLRSGLVLLLLTALWLAPTWALGLLLERFLTDGAGLWPGLGIAQAIVLWTQIVLIGFFLAARGFVASAQEISEIAIEPAVEIPRSQRPVPATEVMSEV